MKMKVEVLNSMGSRIKIQDQNTLFLKN